MVGPWVDVKSFPDYREAEFTFSIDGQEKQRGALKQMMYSTDDAIAIVRDSFTLVPGDVIFTGDPWLPTSAQSVCLYPGGGLMAMSQSIHVWELALLGIWVLHAMLHSACNLSSPSAMSTSCRHAAWGRGHSQGPAGQTAVGGQALVRCHVPVILNRASSLRRGSLGAADLCHVTGAPSRSGCHLLRAVSA